MKTRHAVPLATAAVAAILLAGCGGSGAAAARPVPAVPVIVAKAETRDVPVSLRAVGSVKAVAEVDVRTRVGGELTGVRFVEGGPVSRGQVLFTLDPRPFQAALAQAEGALARDEALLKKAEDDVARYGALVKQEYVTREQYDAAVAQADALRASIRSDRAVVDNARLDLEFTTISSPIAGRAGTLSLQAGNLVKANDDTPLVKILQVRPVWVEFAVAEKNLAEIRARAAEGRLEVRASAPGAEGAGHVGALAVVDNAVDPRTGTIRLRATFPNDDEALWPGQFVDVWLRLSERRGAIVVPSSAVLVGQQGPYVFVVKGDSTAETRPVTVDRTIGDDSVLSKGVAAGETVVVDGQLRIVPGSKVEAKERAVAPAGRDS